MSLPKSAEKMAITKSSITRKRTKATATATANANANSKEERRKASKANGSAAEPEVLIVPSSSTESSPARPRKEEPNRTESSKKRAGDAKSPAVKEKRKQRKREEGDDSREESKLCSFPMNRLRTIVRSEDPELRINQEAYFLINKATEKFIEQFCEDAFALAAARDLKKTFKYKYLSSLVSKWKRYDFLSDFVPERIKAEDALALAVRNPEET